MHGPGKGFYILSISALIFCLLLPSAGCGDQEESAAVSAGDVAGGPNGKVQDRMEWFSNVKFGLFIHWGPYSNLAGEWNGKKVGNDRNSEWIMNFLEIPRDEYRELAREFNPVDFNAGEWVSLARDAGMKYLVITAKHHDGFAMYDSKVSGYNIVDWTPFEKDPIKELSSACRENDIRFGFYYSQREDWDEPYAYGNTWDFEFTPEENLDKFEEHYLKTKAEPQLRELLTEYGPVDLIWFDRGLYTQEQAAGLRELVRGLQPDCLVNGRIGNYNSELMGDFQELDDNGMPSSGIEEYWETPQTLNDTWGYSRYDHNWKSSSEVIRRLVEIVSKGGNYLLNIGPDGLGRIPEPSRKVLRETGSWMKVYGESIYGTSASPLEAADWGFCTRKGRILYLHITDWPDSGQVEVTGLLNRIETASPLAEPDKELDVSAEGNYPLIDIRKAARDKHVTVIKLELDGEPRVTPPVVLQASDKPILLDYESAITEGKAVKRFNRKGRYHVSGWQNEDDSVKWNLRVAAPGMYSLRIKYAVLPSWAGQRFTVSVDGVSLNAETLGTGDWYDYADFELGTVSLAGGEDSAIEIRPEGPVREHLMYLKEIVLEPASGN